MARKKLFAWVSGVCGLLLAGPLSANEPTIVTSIRPLQWLVEALAPPGTPVQALLPVGQSAHDYVLRPGDVAAIQASDLLVWVGPAMEPWLDQLSKRLPEERVLALQPGTPAHVHGRLHEQDAHGEHAAHANEKSAEAVSVALTADPHIWLDPTRMAALAEQVAVRLQQLSPGQESVIRDRLQVFQLAMATLDKDLQARFAAVKGAGFVVYHDSYAPLVSRYGLNQRAAVWKHEAMTTGARDRAAMRALLQEGSVACVFYEPEYGREAVTSWLAQQATGVNVAELDPLGGSVANGPDAYIRLMHRLADGITGCLAGVIHQVPHPK